jgi:dienelactone hydrolase
MQTRLLLLFLLLNPIARFAGAAAHAPDLPAILAHEIVGPALVLSEVQDYLEPRVPEMPPLTSAKNWTRLANRLRADVLKRVVLRGEAAHWNAIPAKVEWLDTIPGGPGYHIRKVRYEAVPGLWIPALLYEPDVAAPKMPVLLAVNGHDPNGKVAGYKQALCINEAKRGVLALNVEWLGMGQFAKPNYQHSRMNQLDLCGTSGVSPFYLSMKRGLDLLLSLPHADPQRVAVTGHSGGGWQTIFISSLDTRVTLSDPVAGYSGFRVRVRHLKDLGDSEQAPCDLATVADYLHLTAMMAPRALLLTYNANDECCYEAGYVLPTLLAAAQPVYQLLGQESRLRWHINYDPGTHNYERDNREAFYQMEGDNFYAGDTPFDVHEIASDAEFKTKEQLEVPLPEANADFNSLALALSKDLPRAKPAPAGGAALRRWQKQERARLRAVVKAKDYAVSQPAAASRDEKGGVQVIYWRLRTGNAWTLPATELLRGQPQGVTLLIADGGRRSATNQVERLLAAGQRVVALDPFYFGEGKPYTHDYLWGLTLATIGDRPLGLQASQVAAVARWLRAEHPGEPITVCAVGPRTSTVALVAAGLEEHAIARLELQDPFPTLKAVIQQNHIYEDMPEMFCFGLLEWFDMPQLKSLVAPRPVIETTRF